MTRVVNVGGVLLGGGNPVRIQSMNNTKTQDIKGTLEQIARLHDAGCDITRVTVPNQEAADALKTIVKQSPIPVVADIHFDYRMAIEAAKNGASKIRINPGNIGGPEKLKQVADICKERGIPIRVGVNSGSIDRKLVEEYGGVCAENMTKSALDAVKLLEDVDFDDIRVRRGVCLGAALHVLVHGEAADVVDDGFRVDLPQPGQLLRQHPVDAGVLEPHGVEHPALGLGDAGGGVAEPGLPCGALDADSPQAVDVIPLGELVAEAEGAAGGDDGVLQPDPAEGDRCFHHRISSFSSTGPSRQMRLFPYLVLQVQPMQAPKPQPIRSSKLNWPEVFEVPYTAFSMGPGPQV